MELDPSDQAVALEFAFLSYEAKDRFRCPPKPSRGAFLIRHTPHRQFTTAETGISKHRRVLYAKASTVGPRLLKSGRSRSARTMNSRNWPNSAMSLHLAGAQYLALLADVCLQSQIGLDRSGPRQERAPSSRLRSQSSALLAASRGNEPRASERARELLPDRYLLRL